MNKAKYLSMDDVFDKLETINISENLTMLELLKQNNGLIERTGELLEYNHKLIVENKKLKKKLDKFAKAIKAM